MFKETDVNQLFFCVIAITLFDGKQKDVPSNT